MVRTTHGLILDLKFAFRVLLRNPTMTEISVFVPGLGIGATTSVFSVVDATVLTPPHSQIPVGWWGSWPVSYPPCEPPRPTPWSRSGASDSPELR